MPLTLSTDFQNAVGDPERYGAILFTFTFGANVYGLWTREGELTYNAVLYQGGGSVLQVDDVEQNIDGSVVEYHLKLSASPEKGLSADILQTFYDENWQFGRVVFQLAFLDPAIREPVGVITLSRGQIMSAPLVEGPGGLYIDARVVSTSIRLSEQGANYRNDANQKGLDSTDTALVGIGSLGGAIKRDLKWGQTP